MSSQDLLRAVYKAHEGYCKYRDVTFDEFRREFNSYVVYPLYSKEEVVGAFLINRNEIHMSATKGFNTKKAYNEVWKPLTEQYLELYTAVFKDNKKGLAFVKHAGFEQVYEDDKLIYLRKQNGRSS